MAWRRGVSMWPDSVSSVDVKGDNCQRRSPAGERELGTRVIRHLRLITMSEA